MSDQSETNGSADTAAKKYEQVLISVSNPRTADQLVRLAHMLTDTSSVLHIVNVTSESSFPARAASWRRSSKLVMDMTHLATRLGRVARPISSTARSIPDALLKTAGETEADLIIMGWFGRVTPLAVKKSRVVNKVLHRAGRDTVVFKSRGDLNDVKRLIVPVGPQVSEHQLALVRTLLRRPLPVVLVHVLSPGSKLGEQEAGELLAGLAQRLHPEAETRVVRAIHVTDGILSMAEENDLIVPGPGREWVFNSFLFGRRADQITNRAPCSVLMYKAKEQKMAAWLRGLLDAVAERLTGGSD